MEHKIVLANNVIISPRLNDLRLINTPDYVFFSQMLRNCYICYICQYIMYQINVNPFLKVSLFYILTKFNFSFIIIIVTIIVID